MSEYSDLLKHPLWQKKRLEVFERAGFRCLCCESEQNQLHAHHIFYRKGAMPWEYEDGEIIALCDECHDLEHDYGDAAWRYLKRRLIASNCFHDSASSLADAFENIELANNEWPALARCIKVALELKIVTGEDLSDVARRLEQYLCDDAKSDDGRDDAGYDRWIADGCPPPVERTCKPAPADMDPF